LNLKCAIADRYRKFQRLSRTEQKLFIRALAVLSLVVLSHRLFGFTKTHSFLRRRQPGRDGAVIEIARHAVSTARMIAAAARYGGVRTSCLARSETLWWMLRRQGIAGELRIGVRKNHGAFAAHAWVEWKGRVLNDGTDVHERFAALERPGNAMGADFK
jgi:hypothetical protein